MQLFTQQTDKFVHEIQNGLNSILVAVRKRPLNQRELLISPFQTVDIIDRRVVSLLDPEQQLSNDYLKKNRSKETQYAFDFAFDDDVSTNQVYQQTTAFLLDGLLEGFNATVLAYGPTCCGKTFTMVGNQRSPGIMQLAMTDLLRITHESSDYKQIVLKASYIEIYNESIKDLLTSHDNNFEPREDPKQGIVIAGITQISIKSLQELNTLLMVGSKNRSKERTGANQASSRSHAILMVNIRSKDIAQSVKQETLHSKLNLVDLAGSERASNTTNRGLRLIEGAKINRSLLVLGNCIQALSENKAHKYVPYRDSKLTRLLKDSLGGNCRTVLLVALSPFIHSFEDTYNTLMFANRAKNIKNNAKRNVLFADAHLNNYVKMINGLKKENEELRQHIYKAYGIEGETLPFLNNRALLEDVVRHEKQINKHFDEEIKTLNHLHQLELQKDQLHYQLLENQLMREYNYTLKKSNEVIQGKLQDATSQHTNSQLKYNDLLIRRRELLSELKKSSNGRSKFSSLLSLFRQKKAEAETMALANKSSSLSHEKKQHNLFVTHLQQKLSERDRIIMEQKYLLQKNSISDQIDYSKMGMSSSYYRHTNIDLEPPSDRQSIVSRRATLKKKQNKIIPFKRNQVKDISKTIDKHKRQQSQKSKENNLKWDKKLTYESSRLEPLREAITQIPRAEPQNPQLFSSQLGTSRVNQSRLIQLYSKAYNLSPKKHGNLESSYVDRFPSTNLSRSTKYTHNNQTYAGRR